MLESVNFNHPGDELDSKSTGLPQAKNHTCTKSSAHMTSVYRQSRKARRNISPNDRPESQGRPHIQARIIIGTRILSGLPI